MKKYIFLIFILLGCNEKEDFESSEFLLQSGLVNFLDSIALDESGSSFNFVFNPKIYQDSLLVFGDGSFSSIHLYNTNNGSKLKTYSYLDVLDYPLPKTGFSNAYIQSDSLFLLNFMYNKIYVFGINGEFLNEFDLNISKLNTRLNFQPFFESIKGNYYISQRMDLPIKESFLKGKMIAVFSKNGDFLANFGNYPKNYSEGNLALIKGENVVYKNNKFYIINSVGTPILKEYNLNGDLLNFFELKSNFFNTDLHYFEVSPFDAKPMNQIIAIASNSSNNDRIFYLSYVHFINNDLDDPENTFRLMIMKIDLDNKIIKESELVGPWHYFELRSLIPQVKEDTLSILMRGFDENLYLKKFTFE
ncbi:hypothetical protein SAMN04488519_104363 [Algoriphagus ornithinivorans]|uniref:TolB-like 6-blade propeller-like n=1 Tax=Algoriphagus ornithinivorans TaxID=226506 RepID=A0A1I5FF77_9BACT|nr:hypothetical protein [Algoriphagus ornithinivorans]SFO22384.1 hypothetical protein SAMN04488519_104363 [Algoriphagus ornithinivorans]